MTPTISYEIFPPRTDTGRSTLARTLVALRRVPPSLVSVTYGAGGTDTDRSFDAVELATELAEAPIAAHLTCVGVPRHQVGAVIERYLDLGVRHIVALRGDPPEGIDAPYVPHPEGFASTADLVAAVRRQGAAAGVELTVSVSAYPEVHPQSPDIDHDLDVLAAKVDAGADRAMTQMFFDDAALLRYRDAVRSRGIDIPIIPGVMPIHAIDRVVDFARRCGATVPPALVAHFDGVDATHPDHRRRAVDWTVGQITDLRAAGFDELHLYTLNQSDLVLEIVDALETP
jgi:methylenetetrahydrofolate reductase (NADPH)